MNPKLRSIAAGAAVGLILALAFPDSMGTWPLRLITNWPGELGRALGNLFTAGRFAPLGLGQSPDVTLFASALQGRALAAALGLGAQIAAALALLRLVDVVDRPRGLRWFFGALGAAALIAAVWPPIALVAAAELATAAVCAVLAVRPQGNPRATAAVLIAGTAGAAPLAELRPQLLGIGHAQGAIGILESATGVAATALALLAFGVFAAVAFALFRTQPPIAPTPATEPATVPPP